MGKPMIRTRSSDPLAAYNAKRDFAKTAEPKGRQGSAGGNRFVVQKHDATRLHYDFRLEVDGVLKSWAVTRGPSLDPDDKRLAVRTEDHPLDYADFEGTIPAGEYGGGTVMLWDTGTWAPAPGKSAADLEEGHLHFTLNGKRMKGEWLLVRMKGRPGEKRENWLLRKIDDAHAGAAGDLVDTHLTSVKTGRTMREIAEGAEDPPDPPAVTWLSRVFGKKHGTDGPPAFRKPPPINPPGSSVVISNPDRVIFPSAEITKGELADYYDRIAPLMLKVAANRPISLVRCPQGRARQCFFQKHDAGSFGEHVRQVTIEENDGDRADYLYVVDRDGILACVQMGTIEFHGWGAPVGDVEHPDRLVFDLDPDESVDFADVKKAARDIQRHLADMGLASFPMLTGGKGVHVIAPLDRSAAWPEVKDFARRFAHALAEAEPERFTAALAKARRKGRIFIDWLRNQRGATAILPYSARARPGAPVAAPVSWDELDDLDTASAFSVEDAERLIERAETRALARWGAARQSLPAL